MKEHNKLSEEEIVKLKNTRLQLNGALLRLGISKEDTHIVLPKDDWMYFNNVLSSGQSSMSKYYQSVNSNSLLYFLDFVFFSFSAHNFVVLFHSVSFQKNVG